MRPNLGSTEPVTNPFVQSVAVNFDESTYALPNRMFTGTELTGTAACGTE